MIDEKKLRLITETVNSIYRECDLLRLAAKVLRQQHGVKLYTALMERVETIRSECKKVLETAGAPIT